MNPAERFKVLEVETVRESRRECHGVLITGLRDHNDAADFLDLRVLRGRNSVHKSTDLRLQICDGNEFLKNILREHVRVSRFIDINLRHVDVLRTHVQVRRGDRSCSPVRMRAELLLFIRFLHSYSDFFT